MAVVSRHTRTRLVCALVTGLLHLPAAAAHDAGLPSNLTDLSLAQLMAIDVVVTSPTKKEQRLSDSAAAVFVITQDDIRRSGVTSLPEALRMAPGVQVAHINANAWAISVRGFNGRFADKLLVLIDGRSVYTPLFSGVFWEVQDTPLEEVERIEVIHGPGAALWGANAVNGIISIITKHARDTQGGRVTAGAGSVERGFASMRYGGTIAPNAYYRVYSKYFRRGDFVDAEGRRAADHWEMAQGGFRVDWEASARDSVTLQGDTYRGETGQATTLATPLPPFTGKVVGDTPISGFNVLGPGYAATRRIPTSAYRCISTAPIETTPSSSTRRSRRGTSTSSTTCGWVDATS